MKNRTKANQTAPETTSREAISEASAVAGGDTCISELECAMWAVTDGRTCLASHLTYREAAELSEQFPKGIVVTQSAASRLEKR